MPRWEAVATFALVAFILCVIYGFAVALAAEQLEDTPLRCADPVAIALALWLTPSFALMALAIRADVWRRERPIADALVLAPICLAMPSIALIAQVFAVCASGDCLS